MKKNWRKVAGIKINYSNNVNLWFAKDEENKTILINDITEENKHNKYKCPICGGLVRPKTGNKLSWHYAHANGNDCSSESMVHWWVKNELLKVGDMLKINIDMTIKEFKCKEILIENTYETSYGKYKPDLTIITDKNETIYFEIANTNKKKLKNFINIWEELGNIVVEVKVKNIIEGHKIDVFNAFYFKGKIIKEKSKEIKQIADKEILKGNYSEEQLNKIN